MHPFDFFRQQPAVEMWPTRVVQIDMSACTDGLGLGLEQTGIKGQVGERPTIVAVVVASGLSFLFVFCRCVRVVYFLNPSSQPLTVSDCF